MERLVFVFTGLFILILIGCKSSKETAIAFLKDDPIIAWNEDTVNNYQVALKNNIFYYTIGARNGLKDTFEYYKGTYCNLSNKILLNFTGKQPNGIAAYFIPEASGHYLIQYFTDGRKRMFLRIQRRRSYDW